MRKNLKPLDKIGILAYCILMIQTNPTKTYQPYARKRTEGILFKNNRLTIQFSNLVEQTKGFKMKSAQVPSISAPAQAMLFLFRNHLCYNKFMHFLTYIKALFPCLLFIITALGGAYPVHAQYETKDSFYYMKDDGVFSDAEKDEEAENIRKRCANSTVESKYFNCACVAGAFRAKRDEEKLEPQARILNNLYNDSDSKCADPIKIAGENYKFCKSYVDIFRSRKADNEAYCKCVANTVSNKFMKNPILKSNTLSKIKVDSMTSCGIKYNQDL